MLDVIVYDERFRELIDLEQDMDDEGDFGGFLEGLIWSEKNNDLIFNTLGNKKTWCFYSKGRYELLKEETNIANGMTYDRDGNIIICEQIGYRMAKTDRAFSFYEIIADSYDGKVFNSPNDVVIHSNGTVYFTDPHYGRRPTRHGRFSRQPQKKQRVYGIRPHDNSVFVATEETNTPNGLCFSLDEKQVYFSETTTSEISVMDVSDDGTFTNRRVLAVTPELGHGGPDGIKLDGKGNIWCCAQGGIQVYSPDGRFLGLLKTPAASGNLCFGGDDGHTLFMGADSHLVSVRTKTKRP